MGSLHMKRKTFRLPHRVRDAGLAAIDSVGAEKIACDCSLSTQSVERALCGSAVHPSTGATIERWLRERGYLTETDDDLPALQCSTNLPGGITPGIRNVMQRGRRTQRRRP